MSTNSTAASRRFRGGVDGVVDLRDIPAHNIERIEIIRGPASSLYGSDAMAGVVEERTWLNRDVADELWHDYLHDNRVD